MYSLFMSRTAKLVPIKRGNGQIIQPNSLLIAPSDEELLV